MSVSKPMITSDDVFIKPDSPVRVNLLGETTDLYVKVTIKGVVYDRPVVKSNTHRDVYFILDIQRDSR